MAELLVNYELESMCKEAIVAYFKVLSQHLPEATGVNQHSRKTAAVWADIRI